VGLARASSKSSSLFELIGDRDTSELHEDWDEIDDNVSPHALSVSEEDDDDDENSQPYFGTGYKLRRSTVINFDDHQPLIVTAAANRISTTAVCSLPGSYNPIMDSDNENHGDDWHQAGENADARDLAGIGAHGRLDVTVGEPRKENESTQNQYISYLVTTDVSSEQSLYRMTFTDALSRPTLSHSNPPTSPLVVASPISSFFTRLFAANIHNAQSLLYQTSTRWNTYAETDLDKTLPPNVPTLLHVSARVSHYTLSCVVLSFSSSSWRATTGMPL